MTEGAAAGRTAGDRERVARTVVAVAAAVLVVLAARLPVWEARLTVVQYPGRQLVLTAYGDRLTGDVSEVKILNHYVGLHVFDMAELDETALWIPAIVVAFACVVVAWAIPRRRPGEPKPPRSWIGTLARIGLWAIPLGILVDVQFRLYQLGHSMDPAAAFREPPFIPPVVGKAHVSSNVTTTAWPGRAVVFLLLAAFLMTFGMSLYRFARQLLGKEQVAVAAALVAVLLLAAPVAAAPLPDATPVDVQALVDAAPDGSTVTIPAGVHTGPLTIDHPLRVVGAPGAAIDGRSVGSVVTIAAPGVELAGIALRGSAHNPVGAPSAILIQREGAGTFVHDVTIRESYVGITVQRAPDVVIEHVDIEGSGIITGEMHVAGENGTGEVTEQLRGDGIWLYDAPSPTVRGSVLRTVRDGIYLAYGSGATIEGTTVIGSRYAVHDMYTTDATIEGCTFEGNLSGMVLMYGGPVRIAGNSVTENGSPSTGYGIVVKDAAGVTIASNVLADNRVGLLVDDAGRTGTVATMVDGNTIAMNQVGTTLVPSADPTFTGNAFIENTTQVALGGTGTAQARWSLDGVGNHWSDYGGFDVAGDGTGDLAYTRSGRISQLVAEEPMLLALASGPAFRLLSAVEDSWAPGEPLVRDDAPQIDANTPSLAAQTGGPMVPLGLAGSALGLVCGVALLRGRKGVRHA